MEVTVMSRETIVPSSPTPPHLKTFQLSLFDQLSPLVYTPLSFFYATKNKNNDHPDENHEQVIATLKKSLSETLTHFFLLAGRIVDTSICCGDNEGAIFIEASINCTMFEVLEEPNNEVLSKLIPCSALCTNPVEDYAQIVVQVNLFMCGGIAISLCLLHKLMDATALSFFLRSWSSINRGSSLDPSPNSSNSYEVLSSLFPQTNLLPFHPRIPDQPISNSEQKRYCQRVVFKANSISTLRAKVTKSSNVSNPTCVEVLTCFIWKHVMQAMSTRTKGNQSQKPSILTHVVNLRKRSSMEPKLSEFSMGNLVWIVFARYLQNENNPIELSELVRLLRRTFEEVDHNYIQKLVGDEGSEAMLKLIIERGKLVENESSKLCMFTSWRNMDFDKVDFGWGKPTWIGIESDSWNVLKDNLVVFMDTMSGDGVEAWITLDEKEMKVLVQNPEFLEFAVLNPTIPLD